LPKVLDDEHIELPALKGAGIDAADIKVPNPLAFYPIKSKINDFADGNVVSPASVLVSSLLISLIESCV
jgi:hypothetical protein